MIEFTNESHDHIVVANVSGKLTVADYQDTIIPKLDELIAAYGKASALVEMGSNFNGWELKAICMDVNYGFKHRKDFLKLAIVNAPCYVKCLVKMVSCLVTAEVKAFAAIDRDSALEWIND